MKGTSIKVTRLSDDIRKVFITAFGEKSEMIRLCKDHRDPLQHYDKKPVLNITQDEFVGIFGVNSHHYSLSPDQAYRFGTYCRLDLPNLIALMLKAGCEAFLSVMSVHAKRPRLNQESKSMEQDLIAGNVSDFRPDTGKIFSLIRNNPDGVNANITYGQVDFIISDLLDQHKFLIRNDLISQLYPGKEITEEVLLNNIPVEQKDTYVHLKEIWKIKSTGLDNILLNLERKKRLNLGLENKYLGIFGNLEAEKSGLAYRAEKYSTVLMIIQDQPGLFVRELLTLAEEKLIEAETVRNDLKNKITRSRNCIENIIPEGTPPVSNEFRDSYIRECKLLLKKLYLLLHSDTCPGYSGLSRRKRTEINTLWLELMKSNRDEMFSFSPSMLLYSLPDYNQLESIYKRACDILGIDSDCYEPGNRLDFMIRKGVSIKAIIDFLINDTAHLEIHLARLELIQDNYTNEDQAQLYRCAIENRDVHTEKLKSEIAELKEQIINLKKEISSKLIKVTR